MKKVFSFLIAALAVSTTQAQDINDAYRYSSEQLGGTARYRALSGAFGALGGDLSAMSANPAGQLCFPQEKLVPHLEIAAFVIIHFTSEL